MSFCNSDLESKFVDGQKGKTKMKGILEQCQITVATSKIIILPFEQKKLSLEGIKVFYTFWMVT